MFRINLLSGILFKSLMSCTCFRSAVVITVCLASLGLTPIVWGDPIPFVVLTGESASNFFGHSVSDAGDVNDDGVDDVIVGAPRAGGNGRAYVYFGGSNADAVADITFAGEPEITDFGYPVSSAGDINGDGIADLMVGAAGDNTVLGRVYIYFEGPGADTTADLILFGEVASDQYGFAASDVGDANGDGFDDVIVGAPYNDAGGPGFGRVYVYCGGPGLDAIADLILTGEEANDHLGYSVSAGDVNGDGFSDFIASAPRESAFEIARAFIYYAGPEWDSIVDFKLTSNSPYSVAGGADFNGDGFEEIMMGPLYANQLEIDYGGPDSEETPTLDLILHGENPGDSFGAFVSNAGDVNGDNYGDVIVGAPGNDVGGDYAGRAYVYFGSASPDETADLTMTGEATLDTFGMVSGAGDFNGDGYDDVIVGASRNDTAGEDAGKAYVYLGGPAVGGQVETGIQSGSPATMHLLLSSPHPNPLVGTGPSLIQFTLDRPSTVGLFLQDVRGRTVAHRETEYLVGGAHSISWNPGKLPSGVYYLRIEAGADAASTRWVIVR